jgi:hypothetical protein
LKQAAEAPTDPFVLPTISAKPTSAPPPPPPAPSRLTPAPEPEGIISMNQELPKNPTPPVQFAPKPPPPPISPNLAPKPPLPQTPKPPMRPPIAPPPPMGAPAPRVTISQSPQRSRVGLFSAIGALVALLLIGGGGYFMASNGSNIPFLYTMVSGLSGDGKTASTSSLAFVKAQKSYTFTSDIQLSPLTDKDKPALPAAGDTTTEVPVYILHAISDASHYTTTGDFTGYMQVAVNGGAALPMASHIPPTGKWSVIFPGSDIATVQDFDSTGLAKTVLYPVVRPIPIELPLEAVQTSHSFEKRTSSGKVVSAYSVILDASKFKGFFPSDATLSAFSAILELTWKNGTQPAAVPIGVSVQGTVSYKQHSYQFTETWVPSAWNDSVPTNHVELASLAGASAGALTLEQYIAELGIGSLGTLPNSVNGDAASGTTSTVTSPTGEAITKLGTTITTSPVVPTQPADANAKKRDAQRKQDLSVLHTVLEKYKKDNGQYPISSGIEQTISSQALFNALVGKYLTKMPVDPLPQTYWYEYQSDGASYALRSIIEDQSDTTAKKGNVYYFYEILSK